MPDNHTQQRVYHYRSSAITNSEIEKPNANNLDFGEIAINYNAQEPSLFIKQNNLEIAQFVDKKYIEGNYITSAVTSLNNFATSANVVTALNNKVDKVSGKGLSTNDFDNAYKGKLDNIASGAEVNVQSDWNVSDSNSDAYIKNKPTIGNAALTIQKNGTNVGSFSANQTTNKTINIAVPTTASDVNALPDSTKYAASLSLDINSSTYVVTAQLKDQEGNNLGTQQTIDLPLETMVVSGSYISSAKTVSLVLQNGNKIEFSVADLVSGLQTEITESNKLSADLIENGNTNKVFTSSEKTKLSNLASSLATTSASGYMSSDMVAKLNGIESGATNGFNTMLVWYNDNHNEHIWSNERVADNYNCFSIKPGSNIKLGIDNSRSLVISALTNNSIENITYSELKQLRDSSGLTPNQQYRITDYETLINPYSFTLLEGVGLELMASAASHSFDIIVRAITNDTLDSNASACHHEGDTYFANSQLDKWKLEYTLDNDQTKYFWALNSFTCVLSGEDSTYSAYMIRNGMEVQNSYYFYGILEGEGSLISFLCDDEDLTNGSILYDTNKESQIAVVTKVTHNIGKGVIYHMIDEWDNDCPYDFKNILFKRNNFSIVASDRDDNRYIYLTDSNGDEYYRTHYEDVYKVDDDSINYFINDYKNPVGETIYTKSTSAAVSTVVSAHTIFYEKETYLNDNQSMMWQIKHQLYNTLNAQNFDMVFGSISAFMYTFQEISGGGDLSVSGYSVKNLITKTVTTCGIYNIWGSLSRPLYVLPNNVFLSIGQEMGVGMSESIYMSPVSDNILIDSQYNTLCGFVNGLKMTKSMFNYLNSAALLPNIFEYSHTNVIFITEIATVNMKSSTSNFVFGSVYLESSSQNIIISDGTNTSYIKNSTRNRLANIEDIKLDYCNDNVLLSVNGSNVHLLTTNYSFLYNIGYSSLYTKHCFSMQLIKPGVPLDMKYLSDCIIDNPIIFPMDSNIRNVLTVSQNSNGVVKYYNEADLIQ